MLFKNQKEERQGAFLLYEKKVRQQTEKTFKREWIDNKEFRGKDFHLDHLLSIKDCFINNVPVEFAAHECNLQIVSKEHNQRKGRKSTITVSELFERITERESDILGL